MLWLRRLWNLLRSNRLARELDEEIDFHIDARTRDNKRAGMPDPLAHDYAARRFGNRTSLREKMRDADVITWLETAAKDLWFAARDLRKNPGFAVAAILTLALGVGANTAIFSVVKAILLDQLPYRQPDRLVILATTTAASIRGITVDFTTTYDWRTRSRSFEDMALFRNWRSALVEGGDPELISGLRVNANFFETLGVKMQLGHGFTAAEDRPDRWHVLVLSNALWRRRFGGDPHIIGRVVRLNEASFAVVGVLPPGFRPLSLFASTQADDSREMFAPLGYALGQRDACRGCQHLRLVARLKPGVSPRRANAELNAIMRDIVHEHPESYDPTTSVSVTPLFDEIVGKNMRDGLWLLSAAVTFVFLIACTNIAGLLLARTSVRVKEITMRAALGATKVRLMRQLLTESLLLAGVGAVAGVLLAEWGTRVLISLAPRDIPRIAEIQVQWTALLFGLAAGLCAGILFGLVPAIRATRFDLVAGLKSSGKSTEERAQSAFRRALVSAQIALAFTLVFGAGLLAKSFARLMDVDPGFEPKNVLTLETYVYSSQYQNSEMELAYENRAMQLLKRNPQIESTAMVSLLPFADFDRTGLQIRAHPLANSAEAPSVDRYSVSPDYFRVMRIPRKQGRLFTEQDRKGTQPVAIISQGCAQSEFAGQNAVGQQIQLGSRDDHAPWATIVGVVGDVRQYGLDRSANSAVYLPQAQNTDFSYSFVARTRVDPRRLEQAARNAFLAADKTQPVFNVRPLEDYLRASVAERSFTLSLLALFGGLALLLAAVGIYGVISYSVTVQTREFGIRASLGATRSKLWMMVGRDAARLLAYGLPAGLVASLALSRFIATLLFDIKPWDLLTCTAAVIVLCATALAAALLPARRAATIDPAVALRHE